MMSTGLLKIKWHHRFLDRTSDLTKVVCVTYVMVTIAESQNEREVSKFQWGWGLDIDR